MSLFILLNNVLSQMRSQLTTTQSKKRLADYQTIVTKKKRLKEESQRRKSVNPLPSLSARRPLRPTNLNVTVTKTPALNTTVTISKPRRPSLGIAVSPPWCYDDKPRYHEDPCTAMSALHTTLGL